MGHSVVFTFTCRYQNKSEQTGAEGGSQGASAPGLQCLHLASTKPYHSLQQIFLHFKLTHTLVAIV